MDSSNNWIWKLIQGIIALALGLFIMFGGDTANTSVAYAIGIFLLLTGAIQLWRGAFNRQAAGGTVDLMIGLIGTIGGAIVLALLYFTDTGTSTIYTILAIVLIAYGAVGLFETLFARGRELFSWGALLVDALLVLLGVLVFVSRSQDFDLNFWGGLSLTLIGLIMAAYAYFVQRSSEPDPVPAPAPKPVVPEPKPAPPKPVEPAEPKDPTTPPNA